MTSEQRGHIQSCCSDAAGWSASSTTCFFDVRRIVYHRSGQASAGPICAPRPARCSPWTAGKAGDAEDLRDYRPDFYLPDDPAAPVTAEGGVWLEHHAHDRSDRAGAEFAGYEEGRAWKRRLHESLSTRYVETSFGDMQRAWDRDGPPMAELLVERLRAAGVEIDDPARWTVEATDDVGDGSDAGPGPLTADAGGRCLDRRGAPPAGRAPAAHGARRGRGAAAHRRCRAAAL